MHLKEQADLRDGLEIQQQALKLQSATVMHHGNVISNNNVMSNANSGIGGFVGAIPNIAVNIQSCAALNNTVTTVMTTAAQIGKTGKFLGYRMGTASVFTNNYANSGMSTNGTSNAANSVTNLANLNITGYDNNAMLTTSFFTSIIVWDTGIWNITDGLLPTLK